MLPENDVLLNLMFASYIMASILAVVFVKNPRRANILPNIFSTVGALFGIVLSLIILLSNTPLTEQYVLSGTIPYLQFTLTIDRLAAFFLLSLSILTGCVSLYSIGYLQHYYGKKNIATFNLLYNLFIVAMILVFTAGNMSFFLIAWEIMSLVSYFLVTFENEHKENLRAGIIYLVMTHLGTAFITIAMAIIASYSGSLGLATLGNSIPANTKNIAFILFLVGFGTKAGIIPLHIWLPLAHPAAPSNVSALMSGVMINTAIYGMIRFIMILLGPGVAWWGIVIMILGLISAILGITFALAENNLKRLLAYSSIENMGIILIGLGLALIALNQNHLPLAALALFATLFHTFNHSLFKGALFLGAGSLHYATHSKDLEDMGGLMKRMPFTGLLFLLSSLAISALPPFNGFVSEWLTYQALFTNLALTSAGLKILSILAVAGLALSGGMAAACFVKVVGIAFLGLPRSKQAQNAQEVPKLMYGSMTVLVICCVLLGVFPRLFGIIPASLTEQLLGINPLGNLAGEIVLLTAPLSFSGNLVLPAYALLLLLVLLAGIWLFTRLVGGKSRERAYGTWDCGFPIHNSRMQYSATGFSKPFRIVLRIFYHPSRELKLEQGPTPYYPRSVRYVVATQPVIENVIYRPLVRRFNGFARLLRLRVQAGSVHIYLTYIFVTLIILLAYNVLY